MINANLTNALAINLTCAACGESFADAFFINGQWICGRHYDDESKINHNGARAVTQGAQEPLVDAQMQRAEL